MPNAIEMLREDHRKVKELFQKFQEGEGDRKVQIAEETLHELEVHTALEEEIFYPAARAQVKEEEKLDEALEEHHVAKLLVNELKKMRPGKERFDAKYKVLAESVKHHIQEEESDLFPQLEENGLDLEEIGQEMEERKQKLEEKLSGATASRQSKTNRRSKSGAKRARQARGQRQKGRPRKSGSGRRRKSA